MFGRLNMLIEVATTSPDGRYTRIKSVSVGSILCDDSTAQFEARRFADANSDLKKIGLRAMFTAQTPIEL